MPRRLSPDALVHFFLGARQGSGPEIRAAAAFTSVRPVPAQGRAFEPHSLVFAVDGGLKDVLELTAKGTFLPDGFSRTWLWTGDGDSLGSRSPASLFAPGALAGELAGERATQSGDAPENGIHLRVELLPREKDASDFGAALDLLVRSVFPSSGLAAGSTVCLRVEGGLGGRRDHELCNLLEATDFLGTLAASGITGVVDFEGRIVCVSGEARLMSRAGTTFSLCSLRGSKAVNLEGSRYDGDLILKRGSHGLSNEVTARDGAVRVRTSGVFAIVSGAEVG